MIRTVPQTGSTNADLLARLRQGEFIPEGEWLVAERQTAGRGRQGRAWCDGAGNFMGSSVVRLADRDPPAASLSLVVGLALYEAVQPLVSHSAALMLKWPNDLLLGGAKLAGILLEREGGSIVVGIGVNLAAAPDLPDRTTTALAHHGVTPDRELFTTSLAASLERELERWRSFGLDPLIRRWESVAHRHGTPLSVQQPGEEPIVGAFAGLTEDGALRLRLAGGATRVIHGGDVMLAAPEG